MPDTESELERLEGLLKALPEGCEPMLMSELNGFMTAAIICPELVPITDWLNRVMGFDFGEDAAVFGTPKRVQAVLDALMAHHNAIASDLMDGIYGPVCDIDTRNEEIIWVLWADGFGQFIDLYPDGWSSLLWSGDAEVITAYAGLKKLADVARDATGKFDDFSDEDWEKAPDRIARWAILLNDWRLIQSETPIPNPPGKVGRNDPCPCGSGKKYKKCCGLN